jgi:DNA-binding transcriptional LysR family regulator
VNNIDLRLLVIVSELNRTRSVSHAAENLELSQSAVSMSLAKLRRHFNDPLFVRTSVGMEPTPHAVELIQLLQQAEGLLHTALGHHVVFDPKTSDRRFTIHGTDIAQVTFMPALMSRLGKIAPGVQVDLRRMSEVTAKHLESGDADICVGFVPPMGAGYCQQRLFKERFVCAVRADHPRIKTKFGLDEFLFETHVAVTTCGTGHSVLEKTLESKRIKRKVGLTVPSFLGLTPVLASLDYVATLPERLAIHISQSTAIKIFPLPAPVPPYVIVQQWHERYTHDPASKWLRALIAELFTSHAAVGVEKNGRVRAQRVAHQ